LIAKAKSAGKYKGRKPIAPKRQQHVLRLAAHGATKTSLPVNSALVMPLCIEFWRLPKSDVLRYDKRPTRICVPLFPKQKNKFPHSKANFFSCS
jgi:hypothetical protein